MDEINELKRSGMSIQAISQLTGYDRKTIRKYLVKPERPVYQTRPEAASKLEPFKQYLNERLQAGVWNAQLLLRELREREYSGGYTILKDWLKPQRESAQVVAVRRFETALGKQAQVDWGQLENASKKDPSYGDFLLEVMNTEADARRQRYLKTRLQLAHLPYLKTFGQFDFAFQPSIDERHISELRTLRFVHEASNVILLGPPGVGKTHLAVAMAEASIQAGQAAYFMTAHDLVTDLGRAYREGRLDRRLRIYLAPKVLVIDEMGYLPLDELGATIFFQLVSARYERGSIILTSNRAMANGARSSAIQSSLRRFSTVSCTIRLR